MTWTATMVLSLRFDPDQVARKRAASVREQKKMQYVTSGQLMYCFFLVLMIK